MTDKTEKINKDKTLQIRMEQDMYDTLQIFAENNGMTISRYCYMILDYWIDNVIDVKGSVEDENKQSSDMYNME